MSVTHSSLGRRRWNFRFTTGATPEGAGELGRAAGILAGDLALAAAIRAVATCGVASDMVRRLLDLFDAALHITAAGELADVMLALHLQSASLKDSLAMEEQKTSAYSFALPLQAGAVLAGADEHTVDRLGRAGRMLGIAFQLVDDLVGVFGDPAQTGKSATSDLRTRKQTPLLIHATTTREWAKIHAYVGRDLTDEELREARQLLTTSGSRGFVEELADTYFAGAREVVENLGISSAIDPAMSVCLTWLARLKEVAA